MCNIGNRGIIIVMSLLFYAVIFQVIGYATPYWYDNGGTWGRSGLFSVCDTPLTPNGCSSIPITDQPDWLKGVIAMETIAIIFLLFATITMFLFLFKNQSRDYAKVGAFFLIVAGTSSIIGAIVYGDKVRDSYTAKYLSWSFGFVIVGGVLSLIDGVLLLLSLTPLTGYVQMH